MISHKVSSYKDLIFWQRSREVSLSIVSLIRKLPNERVAWIISDQVIRSSFSVGANIAEGFGKYKGKEYCRFLQVALGSAQETQYWLELLENIYPEFGTKVKGVLSLNSETIKMLIVTLKNLRK